MQKAKKTKDRAQELINQLDKLRRSGEYEEVALVTQRGCIYSWQKHKLENLHRCDTAYGFVCLGETHSSKDGKFNMTFQSFNPLDLSGIEELLESALAVYKAVEMAYEHDGEEGKIDEQWDFRLAGQDEESLFT